MDFLRKLCCCFACCSPCCQKKNNNIQTDLVTRLLPIREETKGVLEKDQLFFFGVVPEKLRNQVIDLSTKNIKVQKISCGSNHCLILLDNNEVAIFGSNENGQLGLKIKQEIQENFLENLVIQKYNFPEIQGEYKILDIATGDNFSLVLVQILDKNYLYYFGISQEDKFKDNMQDLITMTLVDLDYDQIKIKKIFAFGERSALLSENNEIFMNGLDSQIKKSKKYKKIFQLQTKISSISLGLGHSLILDVNGSVFAIGDNTYGEIGLLNILFLKEPQKIDFFNNIKVKKICTGARHSLVMDMNNNVYAFGDNSEGQCTGQSNSYGTPMKIQFESNEKIVDIYSGYSHCFLLTEKGDTYSWGDSMSGKLGYLEGNLVVRFPKVVQVLKGRIVNSLGLGELMTVLSIKEYQTEGKNKKF